METTKTAGLRHVVSAADVTATTITIGTNGKQLSGAVVSVRTAAGVVSAWDGALVINSESLVLDNTGSVDWAATDTIDITYF